MAQQLAYEKGILPGDFYASSFSDWIAIENAKPRKDREIDPVTFAKSITG